MIFEIMEENFLDFRFIVFFKNIKDQLSQLKEIQHDAIDTHHEDHHGDEHGGGANQDQQESEQESHENAHEEN